MKIITNYPKFCQPRKVCFPLPNLATLILNAETFLLTIAPQRPLSISCLTVVSLCIAVDVFVNLLTKQLDLLKDAQDPTWAALI